MTRNQLQLILVLVFAWAPLQVNASNDFWEREFHDNGKVIRYVLKTPHATCVTGGGEEGITYQIEIGDRFFYGRPDTQDENDPPFDAKRPDGPSHKSGWGFTPGWHTVFSRLCVPKLDSHPYCGWLQSIHSWKVACPETRK